jgi:ORF6N domain-containing protein
VRAAKTKCASPVPTKQIGRSILVLRAHKVLLDEHLAALYGEDFMFQLSAAEWTALRSQIVISKFEPGGRRYAPYAFTAQGVAMLSSVFVRKRELHAAVVAGIAKLPGFISLEA